MRHNKIIAAVLAIPALAATLFVSSSAQAAQKACHNPWGSTAKSGGVMVQNQIQRVRAGQHNCYDRMVIDLGTSRNAGYSVRYRNHIYADPSGQEVNIRGGAKLSIILQAPVVNGFPVNDHELVNVSGWQTFRQIANVGSFEGVTSFGLGVRARLPFRVLRTADSAGHKFVIVDVAHHWG